MPSTPTTKSQVQAYRFVLRRMESALVRKDPVMLHDPMRSHKRSTVVGVILGVVGLVAFMVVGLLSPSNTVPTSGIVIASPSGTIYVVSQNPHELIPMFNLASARLLLAAAQSQQSSGGSGGSGGGASSAASSGPAQPVAVQDSQLSGIPMGRLTGIPGGPTVLPSPGGGPVKWAVCDNIPRDPNALNQTANATPQTSVLVNQATIGASLPEGKALLASGPDNRTYLIYHRVHSVNDENDSAVKAQINMSDNKLVAALGLDKQSVRKISQALLNAIPSVSAITNPFDGTSFTVGAPGPANLTTTSGTSLTVGRSFQVQAPSGTTYWVVLPNGIQQVTPTIAQIADSENSGANGRATVGVGELGQVTQLNNQLPNIDNYPDQVPTVIQASTKPVVCLGWHADYSDAQQPKYVTDVTTDFNIEMPADKASSTGYMAPVQIGQSSSTGKINWFFMNPPLSGVAIRAASNAKEFASGPIYVIDPRGIRFSVPDLQTAQVLGVADTSQTGNIPPAPESIISLLPLGSQSLSVQAVQKTFDTVPVSDNAGQYMTPTSQPAAGGN